MYDVLVLGGGPGGYVAAIKAGRAGLKTALIEKNKLGGTCLNRGCIPTKYLLHTAEVFGSFAKNDLGLSGENLKYDINTVYEKKNAVVEKLVNGIEKLIENAGVEFFNGEGKITSKSSVEVNGQTLQFKNLIIATGSSVFAPPISGIENALTSDDILASSPVDFKSVIIIGGGVIGIEFATMYAKLGKEVTVVELEKTILPPFDRDLAMQQALVLKKQGVKIINGAAVTKIEKTGCTFTLKEKEEKITADAVIVCIGRIAEINNIGLENAGIEFDKRGIITDKFMQTNIQGIFAIGDAVKGNVMLAHNAENQGSLVIENLTGNCKKEKTISFRLAFIALRKLRPSGFRKRS
ncbi:dihydrolipoyl dehydrogenase family protein [Treponema pedis]|uniref:dihydrolipoyl dehydrogenase family protein n=1 Tax=Treponema pedis TaxID=409322 RepID=UPI0020900FE7|nr:FAD-dependent oxidoreductase [Treponema pedis]